MKITIHTTKHLTIEDRPAYPIILGSLALLGLLTANILAVFQQNTSRIIWTLLGIAGCLGLAAFLKVVRLDFDRDTCRLSWKKRGIFSRAEGEIPFAHIREVYLQGNRTDIEHHRLSYIIFLKLEDGSYFELSNTLLRQEKAEPIAAVIQDVLRKNPPNHCDTEIDDTT